MINKKPKDMTAIEFVNAIDDFTKRSDTPDDNRTYSLAWIKRVLNGRALIAFTPDQHAAIRECIRSGWKCAAINSNGKVYLYEKEPTKTSLGLWNTDGKYIESHLGFLATVFSWNDPDVLYFKDYETQEEV